MEPATQLTMAIEGIVTMKRNRYWVKRYAVIKDHFFSYRRNRGNAKLKINLDLRKCKLRRGQRKNGNPLVEITCEEQKEEISLSFEKVTDLNKWLEVLANAKKTDAKLQEENKLRQDMIATRS